MKGRLPKGVMFGEIEDVADVTIFFYRQRKYCIRCVAEDIRDEIPDHTGRMDHNSGGGGGSMVRECGDGGGGGMKELSRNNAGAAATTCESRSYG